MAEVELIDLVSDSEEEYDIDHVENILNEIENYDPASDKLKEGKKDSLLHRAVQYCLLPTIERVLKLKDVNVNARNGKRETPLHYAAKRDTKIHEVLKLLLRYGTNVEFLDDDGSSAFHVVVTNPEVCLFCLFLMTENNADINLQNKFGKTPLHCALEHGVCPTLTIKFMILFRANVKSVTIDGNYPLHSAVSSKYCSPEILQELAGFGSPVNAINNLGERPLHHALRNSNLNKESITELLALRASINAVNNDLVTPLCQAVIFECPLWVFDLFFFKGSLVNLGINIVQKAIELFNDEPSKERKEIVKMTIRLMLLESTDYNVRAMIAESNGPFELQEYAAECVQEIIAMDKLKTSNGRSFLEILVKEAPIVPVMNEVLKTLECWEISTVPARNGVLFQSKADGRFDRGM